VKKFFTCALSFLIHMILPLVIVGYAKSYGFGCGEWVFFGSYFALCGLSILLTVTLFNMPYWVPKSYILVYGKDALKYSVIFFIIGSALIFIGKSGLLPAVLQYVPPEHIKRVCPL